MPLPYRGSGLVQKEVCVRVLSPERVQTLANLVCRGHRTLNKFDT
jgi:hypothetical protein